MSHRIFIPTYKRSATPLSYNALPDSYKKRVTLVVRPEEVDAYAKACPLATILSIDKPVSNIAETMTWLFDYASVNCERFTFFDDDITTFLVQSRNTVDYKFKKREATEEDIDNLFKWIDEMLDDPTVGIVGPAGSWTRPYNDTWPARGCFPVVQWMSMRSDTAKKLTVDRIGTGGDAWDLDVCLQSLALGLNTILHQGYIAKFTPMYSTAGGIQATRTVEERKRREITANKRLQDLWGEDIVKLNGDKRTIYYSKLGRRTGCKRFSEGPEADAYREYEKKLFAERAKRET